MSASGFHAPLWRLRLPPRLSRLLLRLPRVPAAAPAEAESDQCHHLTDGRHRLSFPRARRHAFIGEGDSVKAGQTLLIVEAMKVMNPITAPKAGTVRSILVGDAQPAEFGEPLVSLTDCRGGRHDQENLDCQPR